jgi:acyl-CoA thioesterase FadM
MARLQLNFPEDQYYYTTLLTVRVTGINAGNHLGNDSMISMISEARARFLFEFGDITFRITRPKDKKLVAMAKQGFVFFNYKTSQVVAMSEDFRNKFERVNWVD